MPAPRSRRLAVTFAAVAVSLAGCGGDTPGGKAPGEIVVLGFVNGGTTEFHICLQQGILSDAGANNAEVITVNSNQDPATELANIQDLIARKVDALIVQTVNVDALKADIAKANSAKIPIFLTSVTTGNTAGILGAVVVDLKEVGKLDAGWVAADAAGNLAEAAVIAGAPGAASDLLVAAVVTGQLAVRRAVALLKQHQIEKISNTPIKLISRENLGDAPQYCL